MALPEHAYDFSSPLLPEDVTAEVQFAEHCRQTEKTMLRDVFRENVRIETPF